MMMGITYGDHLIDSGYYDITPEQERQIETDYECENCIGMIEYGCYCKAMGAVAPGGPLPNDEPNILDEEMKLWR
jgi:hypothetical protein